MSKLCNEWAELYQKNVPKLFQTANCEIYFTAKTSCEESKKRFSVNVGHEQNSICRMEIDGGIIRTWRKTGEEPTSAFCFDANDSKVKKCDYVFSRSVKVKEEEIEELFFIELKSKGDTDSSLRQIFCALLFFKTFKLIPENCKLHAIVVGSENNKYKAPKVTNHVISQLKREGCKDIFTSRTEK